MNNLINYGKINDKTAIRCKTLEDANLLINSIEWKDRKDSKETWISYWNYYKNRTCYGFKKDGYLDSYGTETTYIEKGYTIYDMNDILINNSGGKLDMSEIKFDKNEVKDVIFHNPATIVLWKDGTKTVVKCQEQHGDTYNEELGLAMCIIKKMCGNKGNFNDVFNNWLTKEKVKVITEL
jgi:hypothetical protein